MRPIGHPPGPGSASISPAKFAPLDALFTRGLPVPEGWIGAAETIAEAHDFTPRVEALLARGPVIVRGALGREDGALESGAGLSVSVPGLTTVAAVRDAIGTVRTHGDAPEIAAYYGGAPGASAVLIQREIQRARLLVVAARPGRAAVLDAHDQPGDVLASGASPSFTGSLTRWNHPSQPQVQQLVHRALEALPGRWGLDLEIVIDPDDRPWIVQARPLTRDPFPAWSKLRDALATREPEEGPGPSLEGLLIWDAEHNPAPLSIAHTWIIQRLAAARPASGALVVLAGWLYTKTLPRDLGEVRAPADPVETLSRLRGRWLPEARARLSSITHGLDAASNADLAARIDAAFDAFLVMIDLYMQVLAPARRGFERVAMPGSPASLAERHAYLDVLPSSWDIASPTLETLGVASTSPPGAVERNEADDPTSPMTPARAATLLGEVDDHLFAVGLAPMRHVWCAAVHRLGLEASLGFSLNGDELRAALLAGGLDSIGLSAAALERRRARTEARADWTPPTRLLDGVPMFDSRPERMGIAVGPAASGPLVHRCDLADLWNRPPPSGAVVAIPSLTAQAAVVLARGDVHAVCTEHGGALSHGVLMARELGLTALIGCRGCMDVPEGTHVLVDTRTGRLRVDPTRLDNPA